MNYCAAQFAIFQDVKEGAFSEIIAQHNFNNEFELTCHPHLHHPSRRYRQAPNHHNTDIQFKIVR
jgi:hypothetical protein